MLFLGKEKVTPCLNADLRLNMNTEKKSGQLIEIMMRKELDNFRLSFFGCAFIQIKITIVYSRLKQI